jgi:hypothetical protein
MRCSSETPKSYISVSCSKLKLKTHFITFSADLIKKNITPLLSDMKYAGGDNLYIMFSFYAPCSRTHNNKTQGGLLPDSHRGGPSSVPSQVMWGLWWANRHWGGVSPAKFHSTTCIHYFIIDAM